MIPPGTLEFACPQCDQRFRVDVRNVGRRMRCPVCRHASIVPAPVVAAVQLAERAARKHSQEWSEFAIEEHSIEDLQEPEPVGSTWRQLWWIGVFVLAFLAWRAFEAGSHLSWQFLRPSNRLVNDELRQVKGLVSSRNVELQRGGRNGSDGYLGWIIAMPLDKRLDQRIPSLVMEKWESDTAELEAAVTAFRSLGGDFARIGADGGFALRLALPGQFQVLAIVPTQIHTNEPPRTDLARIGQWFVPAYDLLAGRIYSVQNVFIDRQACLELIIE